MLRRALQLAALSVLTVSSMGCATVSLLARGGPSLSDVDRFPASQIEAASAPSPLRSAPVPLPSERQRWVIDGTVYDGTWDQVLRESRTRALLVARGGELVLEWYDQPSTAHERLLGLSISKPVVSLLLAQAVAAGAVTNLDAPVTRYLPDLANRDARWSDVSLRALDDMRAVLAGPGDRDAPVSVAAQLYVSRDLDRHLRQLRPEPSGANQLNYHSGATQLVATAIEAAAGQRIEHLLAAGVWQPIGAEALATWGRDRADGGRAKAFCCLAAVPRDWLRLGQQFVVPAAMRQSSRRSCATAFVMRRSLIATVRAGGSSQASDRRLAASGNAPALLRQRGVRPSAGSGRRCSLTWTKDGSRCGSAKQATGATGRY